MQEQNFEKQVRDKMDELSFVPSAPVWGKVEEQIRKKKEKKRFIFWLLPLLLAVGSGWWLLTENNSTLWNKTTQAVSNKKENHLQDAIPGGITNPQEESTNVLKTSIRKDGTELSTGNSIINLTRKQTLKGRKTNYQKKQATFLLSTDSSFTVKITSTGNGSPKNEAKPVLLPIHYSFNADSIANSRSLNEKEILVQVNNAKKDTHVIRQSKWQFAISVQGGISGLSEGFGSLKRAEELNFDASPTTSVGGGFGNTAIPPPSIPSSNLGMSVGIDLKRKINNRLSILTGLRYAYYSNTIQVGSLVNRDTSFNRSNAGVLRTKSFYRNDANKQDYTNQYHFIQLPIGVEYKLVKRLPLLLQVGAKVEQMLGSNSLFYNQYGGVYVKDKELLARTGVNLFSGISYQFRSHKAFSFAVGPQVQYGLTNLSKNKSNDQHLYFTSISAQFFLKNK